MAVSAWSGLVALVEVGQGGSVTASYGQAGHVAVWHGETVVSRCEKVFSGSAGFVVAVLARYVELRSDVFRLGMLRCVKARRSRLGLLGLGKVRLGGLVN